MNKLSRYPGAQPFETNQQDVFFGRDKDVEALYRLIQWEPLTVLYSKSGLGKSSLVNAGLVPYLEKKESFIPIKVRFNAYNREEKEDQFMPIFTARKMVRGGPQSLSTFLDKLIEDEESLWHDLKEQQIMHQGKRSIILIFDQFEELFTYPPEAILAFRKQLAESLYTKIPQRYLDILDLYQGVDDYPFSTEEVQLLQKPIELRVLAVIRQDRISLLENLADYLPSIKKTWYELGALDQEQARLSIVLPAKFEDTRFSSNPFRYQDGAVQKLLGFLTNNWDKKIEPTQLQIICHYLEKQNQEEIRENDLDNLEGILENYYEEKINALDAAEQLPARLLIEDGLIYEDEERRLSLYEGVILRRYNVSAETLKKLVESHLLRIEPSLQGGYTYELSHDTIVPSILKAKKQRLEAEKKRKQLENDRLKERELNELRQKIREESRTLRKSINNVLSSSGRLEPDNNLSFFDPDTIDVADISMKSLRSRRRRQENVLLDLFNDFAPSNQVQLTFRNNKGELCGSQDGIFSLAMKYDDKKRLTEISYFDMEGKPMIGKRGNHGFQFEYDNQNNEIKRIAIGLEKEPVRIQNNYAQIFTEYDKEDNPIKVSYYDETGQPCLHSEGNHGYKATFNDFGLETQREFFDLNGVHIEVNRGYSRIKIEYDALGQKIFQSNYDHDDKPCYDIKGYHGSKSEYDQHGKEVKRTFIDSNRLPTNVKDGYSTIILEYNKVDQEALERYFDVEGNPVVNIEGYHGCRTYYDEKDRIISQFNFGLDNEIIASNTGTASIKLTYDALGRTSSMRFFGINGNPTYNSQDNVQSNGFKFEFDSLGNIKACGFIDGVGNTGNNLNGIGIVLTEPDKLGRMVERSFFDKSGNPILSNEIHKEHYEYYESYKAYLSSFDLKNNRVGYLFDVEYDKAKRIIKMSYLDEAKNKIIAPEYAYCTRGISYDFHENVSKEFYYDNLGKPCPDIYGDYGKELIWDIKKNTEIRYLGEDAKPHLTKNGYALERYKYDTYGRLTFILYYDELGNPAKNNNGEHGIEYRYTAPGADNFLQNDEENRVLEYVVSLGLDEKPQNNKEGYAFGKYDLGNSRVSEYFDADMQPVLGPEGFHAYKIESTGSNVKDYSVSYFGVDGSPIDGKKGYASRTQKSKTRVLTTNEIVISYFNSAGQPCAGDEGYHKFYQFDNDDDAIIRGYDSANKLVLDNRKYSRTLTAILVAIVAVLYVILILPFVELWKYLLKKYRTHKINNKFKNGSTFIIRIEEVRGATMAKVMGVEPGDIILSYDGWSLFDDNVQVDVGTGFETQFNETGSNAKTILFARMQSENEFFFYTIDFPPGSMGVRIADMAVPTDEYHALKQKYQAWQEAGKPGQSINIQPVEL